MPDTTNGFRQVREALEDAKNFISVVRLETLARPGTIANAKIKALDEGKNKMVDALTTLTRLEAERDELLAERDRLREENKRLSAGLENAIKQKQYYESILTYDTSAIWALPDAEPVRRVETERVVAILEERDRLAARVAAMEGALKPFAIAGNNIHKDWPDLKIYGPRTGFTATVGDCRRAADALKEGGSARSSELEKAHRRIEVLEAQLQKFVDGPLIAGVARPAQVALNQSREIAEEK